MTRSPIPAAPPPSVRKGLNDVRSTRAAPASPGRPGLSDPRSTR